MYAEWEDRDWQERLFENLSFPIEVVRKTDAKSNPFLAGKDGQTIEHLPLVDLEVTSRNSKNFWPIRKYVVWFANKT